MKMVLTLRSLLAIVALAFASSSWATLISLEIETNDPTGYSAGEWELEESGGPFFESDFFENDYNGIFDLADGFYTFFIFYELAPSTEFAWSLTSASGLLLAGSQDTGQTAIGFAIQGGEFELVAVPEPGTLGLLGLGLIGLGFARRTRG